MKRLLGISLIFLFLIFNLTSCNLLSTNSATQKEIENGVSQKWDRYDYLCYVTNLESIYEHVYPSEDQTTEEFFRIIQVVSFDEIDYNDGIYNYDITFCKDGNGFLHYRHYIWEKDPIYTMDQEEIIELSKDEVSRIKSVIEKNDFQNIPTWETNERIGLDGESTLILGCQSGYKVHLISMWSSTSQDGIYQIRTAIENIVRERIEVTSGSVYLN